MRCLASKPIASGTSPGQVTELTGAMNLQLTAADAAELQTAPVAA